VKVRDIACPDYEALGGSRRCRHYLDGGPCSLPSELMCREWVRLNPHLRVEAPSRGTTSSPTGDSAPRPAPRLSYTRLSLWEQCPLAYRFRYVDRLESESSDAAAFGKAIHAALEHLVREHVAEERQGALDTDRASEHWKRAFAEAALVGAGRFEEGLRLVRSFVAEQGPLSAQGVLAIEAPFELTIGEFTVIGFMDRVDRVGDEAIRILDYKSSRLLFAREELDSSLQASIYTLAAQRLWPWARRIEVGFWMLRHDLVQQTERTVEQLEATRLYVETLGEAIRAATDYPSRPNPNCAYCDYRRGCPTYAELLKGRRELVAEDLEDLEQVAREREEVATVARAAYRRKDELDRILKQHLEERGDLVLAGVKYRTFKVTSTSYPLEKTAQVLSRELGQSEDAIRGRIGAVDNKALQRLLTKLGKERGRAQVRLLKSELEAFAKQTHTPRLWAKAIKEASK